MWGWWDKITTPANLPIPNGPYIPGGVDVMTEYSSNGTFIRLYYPSDIKAESGGTSAQSTDTLQKRWIAWMPEYRYFEGCAQLMGLWRLLVWAGYAIIAGVNASIPVSWGSQFASASIEKNGTNKDQKMPKNTNHPVVIISHGMAGTRFSHSALGLELASNGFVIATVEHRDGSASGTFYFKSQKERDNGEKTWLPYRQVKFGDTKHHKARKEQVELRALELIHALDVLEMINNGELDDKSNVLHTEYAGMEFSLSQMKGKLDLSYPAIIGYSFGGPSALLAIKKDSRFRRAIGLDIWMFPIKEEVEETGRALAQPGKPNCQMFFINSQTFHNAVNLKAMRTLLTVMKGGGSEHKMPRVVTIRGTTHEHLCDWPLLLGSWLDRFLPGKLIPIHGHQLLSKLVMQFLAAPYSTGTNSGVTPKLKSSCDDYIESQVHHFAMGLLDKEESKL